MSKPKVAILTSLTDFSPAYSPTGIIIDQARMLERAGYDYEILVHQNFNRDHLKSPAPAAGLKVSTVLEQTVLHRYDVEDAAEEDFQEQVEVHCRTFKEHLARFDVVITHDLMFLDWYLVQNAAIRMCVEDWPKKRWLHWVHSAPSHPPSVCFPSSMRYQGCPNSKYVFLNDGMRQDLANMMKVTRDEIAVVYNPKDVRDVFGFSEPTCAMIDAWGLLDADLEVLQVYPFSTPRWKQKGVNKLAALFGNFKRQGVRAKLVLVNAHCTQKCDEDNLAAAAKYLGRHGLSEGSDFFFTSKFRKEYRPGVDQRMVRELTQLANLFIFPSESECCSLIQAEAAVMGGKYFVLNKGFQPMLEFSPASVLAYDFNRENPDANALWYEHVAREIWANMRQDATVMNTTQARNRTYNRDWIWRTQLEPLLYVGGDW